MNLKFDLHFLDQIKNENISLILVHFHPFVLHQKQKRQPFSFLFLDNSL